MGLFLGLRRFRGSRQPPDPGFRRRARIPPGFQQKSLKRAPFSRGYRKTPVIAGRFSRPCLPGPWAPISVSGPRIPPDSKSLATAAPPAVQNRPPMCPPPGWGGNFTRGGRCGPRWPSFAGDSCCYANQKLPPSCRTCACAPPNTTTRHHRRSSRTRRNADREPGELSATPTARA